MRDELESLVIRAKDKSESVDMDSLAKEYIPEQAPLKIVKGEKNFPQVQRSSKNLPEDKVHHAITILSEVNMVEISFFSTKQFLEGQSIVIEFQIPQKFAVSAEVICCRNYTMKSCIITPKKLPYRGRAKFLFLRPEERPLLQKFVISIAQDDGKKNIAKKEVEEEPPPEEEKEQKSEASLA